MAKVLKNPPPSTAPTAEIAAIIEQVRNNGVVIPRLRDVETYLLSHPAAASLIIPAMGITRQSVGDEPQLSLEVYCDPELGGEQLTLYVRSDSYT